MAGRKVAVTVTVTDAEGRQVLLRPGDEAPGWTEGLITNPKVWAEEETTGADEAVPATDAAVPDYSAMKVADLRDLIADRNEGRAESDLIPDDGTKADLVAALEADDES